MGSEETNIKPYNFHFSYKNVIKFIIINPITKGVLITRLPSAFIYKAFISKEKKCSNLRFDFLWKISTPEKPVLEKTASNDINLMTLKTMTVAKVKDLVLLVAAHPCIPTA